uniref:hypothetical protein n=1 Tax=Salmonella sp. s54412 TaxID=3160128 RepID=UPI0037552EC4
TKVTILNNSMKTAKVQEEAGYFAEEDSLRSAEVSSKSQLKEEAHMRTVLQARIASDTSDLLRSRIESKKKREKVSQQAEDSVKVVTRIKEQVS